jgi:hypothetical protein
VVEFIGNSCACDRDSGYIRTPTERGYPRGLRITTSRESAVRDVGVLITLSAESPSELFHRSGVRSP